MFIRGVHTVKPPSGAARIGGPEQHKRGHGQTNEEVKEPDTIKKFTQQEQTAKAAGKHSSKEARRWSSPKILPGMSAVRSGCVCHSLWQQF